jgi:outer membrane lipoprotein-sorting protein
MTAIQPRRRKQGASRSALSPRIITRAKRAKYMALAYRANRAIIAAACALFFPFVAVWSEAPETAESIVTKIEANQVYDTSRLSARLTVTNRLGISESEFSAYARKGGDALIVITAGPDRGQKVLRLGENLYLYYPEADDVIWLKGSALKDSLMGSDFSYEDLTDDGSILGRYDAMLEGTESLEGVSCYRVTLVAKSRKEPYAREDLLVDSALFVIRKATLYSAAGKAIRELTARDVRAVSGRNVPFTTVMRDLLKKDSSTVMTIERMEIDVPLPEKYFNREELSW